MSVVTMILATSLQALASETPAEWIRRPQPAPPEFAALIQMNGDVGLACVVGRDSRLYDCNIESVAPANLGFEEAALASTDQALVSPRTDDGRPQADIVHFTIRFRYPSDESIPVSRPYEGPQPSARARQIARVMAEAADDARLEEGALPLGGVPVDRREVIADWLRGVPTLSVEARAAFLSRFYTERELEDIFRGEEPDRTPTEDDIRRVMPEFMPERGALAALRERYCATYGCDVVTSSTAGPVAPPR